MRRGWGTFFVALIPAILLSWALFIAVGTLLSRLCLEQSPLAIRALKAIPFLLPPVLYFLIDRAVLRTFLMLVAVTIPLAIAIPSTEGATQRSKQKETVRRMRAIMMALDANATRTNRFPDANDIASLQRQLGVAIPLTDSWCHPFVVTSNARGYQIASLGMDGKRDTEPYVSGTTYKLEDDIVAKDGIFVRMPEGIRDSP